MTEQTEQTPTAAPVPRPRARRPDTRQLHVRLSASERRAIEEAAQAAGYSSAGRFLVACAAERRREADLIDAMAGRVRGEIQAAVQAELAGLTDRLAVDLAALSAAIADRPSITQMQKFLDVYRNATMKAAAVKPAAAAITGSK